MKIPLFRRNPKTAIDPVCKMVVDVKQPAGGVWTHGTIIYYFCAPGCNRAFQKSPDSYLSGDMSLDMES